MADHEKGNDEDVNAERAGMTRRTFIDESVKGAAALGIGAGLASQSAAAQSADIATRALGRTGVDVSMLCLGGWHIGALANADAKEAIRAGHLGALQEDITDAVHYDTMPIATSFELFLQGVLP